MSDTENKAESKTADSAPYMKKDKHQDNKAASSKSNIVIPLILLLVSAIVIIATFYEDEYRDLVAQSDEVTEPLASALDASLAAESTTTEEMTQPEQSASAVAEKTGDAGQMGDTENAIEAATTNTPQVISETKEQTFVETDSAAKLVAVTATVEDSAASAPANNKTQIQSRLDSTERPSYANRQAYEQARKEAMARRQEQIKKHNEMMQQRRQAYEDEMQARREQYEEAIKAYKEKRAKIAEAQKAIYQKYEQNRTQARQQMEDLQKELAELHEQMHQMMRASQPQVKRDPLPRMTREPRPQFRYNSAEPAESSNTEPMHSI